MPSKVVNMLSQVRGLSENSVVLQIRLYTNRFDTNYERLIFHFLYFRISNCVQDAVHISPQLLISR